MGLNWKEWNRSDVLYAIIFPLVVVLVIAGLSVLSSYLMSSGGMSGSSGLIIGVISEIEEIVITVAIPLLLGLVWNRWAGGTSGFMLGTLWSMWYAVKYGLYTGSTFRAAGGIHLGPTLLGWVLSAMLIGYMAGALNKGSENFRRMLIAAVISTTVGGFFLLGMFQLSPSNVVPFELTSIAITVLTRVAAGVIIAVIAKVFFWYGMGAHKHTNIS